MTRVALVPGVLAFLPEYAGLQDPVAPVRGAALAAVAWLAEAGPVTVVADAQGERVGRALLEAAGGAGAPAGSSYLVVANGSARRSDTAPGYVDERAVPFDDEVLRALREPDPAALTALDLSLARDLLVGHPEGLVRLGGLLRGTRLVSLDYADDPFGVAYWVGRWVSR